MDSRRQLVLKVIEEKVSLSQACRLFGVTRKTGRKWIVRAREQGIEHLCELPKGPKNTPLNRTCQETEEALAKLRQELPFWGGKKLAPLLLERSGIALKVRTADRILSRKGLVKSKEPAKQELVRFERPKSNMLLQMDFKGIPRRLDYALLTVLDDHSRMCNLFEPVKDKTGESVFAALWEMFARTGLPEKMLMDNGDCWGSGLTKSITSFEAKLWRLGILTIHGKPYHPQTQGKVERFHKTAALEMGDSLFCQSAKEAKQVCQIFVDRYNWVRPHEALGGKRPGQVYVASCLNRPDKLPEASIPSGAVSRKVNDSGYFSFKGREYRVGRGLSGEPVGIKEDELGLQVYYSSIPLAYLHEL